MSLIDRIVEHNRGYAKHYDLAHLTAEPQRNLVIVGCMERVADFQQTLGLQNSARVHAANNDQIALRLRRQMRQIVMLGVSAIVFDDAIDQRHGFRL